MEKHKYGLTWIYAQTKDTRLQLAIYALLVLCLPIIQLSFAYFMKLFIDIATGSSALSLMYVGLCSVAAIIAGGIVLMINSVLVKWIYGKTECKLRANIMNVILSRCMADISKQHTGELLTKLTVDVQAVSMCVPTLIDSVAGGAASAFLATTALFFLNWKIAVILLLLTPLLMLLTRTLSPHIQKASAADKANDERNRSVILETLSRMMLIQTYFMQEKTIERMKKTYETKLKSGMTSGMWEGIAAFSGALLGNIMSLVTLGLGACFVLNGESTVGSLIMIVQLLNYIVTPITKFSAAAAQTAQAVASSDRIGMLYELPAQRETFASMPVNAIELVVRNLRFTYRDKHEDGERNDLLSHVNMSFLKGEVTGITGKSGSGKSTLLRLLIGLYAPREGSVELRHTLGVLNGEEILPQVAYVPPENYLFSGSVTDNIIMSESEPRYDEMQETASRANIMGLIQSLPRGFDTLLGESGSTVSSGQAQRIAIARAIYKKAPVIVFDEPTANLDIDSIQTFQKAVRTLAKDKICIIVTHDSSTISVCDKVYTLDHGSVEEKRGAKLSETSR